MTKASKEAKPKTGGTFWDHLEKITREASEEKRPEAQPKRPKEESKKPGSGND